MLKVVKIQGHCKLVLRQQLKKQLKGLKETKGLLISHGKELPTNSRGFPPYVEKLERVTKMADRWKLGNYTFTINPNTYGEQVSLVGDTVVTLDGTVIIQPTTTTEEYNLSSIFYQNRPRVVSQVSMPNLSGIKFVSGKYYVLNNTTKKVDVYNSNLSLSKSITITATPNGENFVAFDVELDETLWVVQSSTDDIVWKVAGGTGTVTKATFNPGRGLDITGIKYNNGSMWIVSGTTIYNTNTSLSILKTLTLPYISPANLAYRGMEIVNGYLVVSFVGNTESGVYHIDMNSGFICNSFALPDYSQIVDVTYDGNSFIFATFNTNQLIYTNGNTLMLDLYSLEKEIKTKGFIDMIDDMGIKRRIAISDYNIERLEGSLAKYSVDIQATKVNRGVV
jgi:hypothetical protein